MKCPACFNELAEIQVGNVPLDVCQGGCGGIWFDAFELQRLDDPGEVAGPLLEIKRSNGITLDLERKRDCPRCTGVKLHRHFFSARRKVQVDQCPNCGGYWLDAGELDQIRREKEQSKAVEVAQQSTISAEFIRYLYRLERQHRNQRSA
jgi:uncharacterized protein